MGNAPRSSEIAIRRSRRPELVVRFLLVPVAVGICYLFSWSALRALTTLLAVRMTAWAYPDWLRAGPDMAFFHGTYYHYVIACTMVDAWCGAIPLVWKLRQTAWRNLAYLGGLAVFVFTINTFRQAALNLLFSAGLPWKPVHDVLAASAYLLIWIAVLRRAAWQESAPQIGHKLVLSAQKH